MNIKDMSWNDAATSKRCNNEFFPKSIRGLIVGKSNCGKTNLLMNLLLRPDWLDYDRLFVFGKSLFQPEYKLLREGTNLKLPKDVMLRVFDNRDDFEGRDTSEILEGTARELSRRSEPNSDVECRFYENADDVPDPKDLKSKDKNLMIFDDLLLERQNRCESYYVRGRHSNVDCFYLSQNYFRLPRQTIRENANFLCLFRQDLKNVNHIYGDHVANDMTRKEFRKLCKKVWDGGLHNFVVIDLTSECNSGKYRSGFDTFYISDDDNNNEEREEKKNI